MPYTKEYYENNRVKILENNKKYRDENSDKIKENSKKYYDEHKKELIEKHRIWAKSKFNCECGAIIRNDRKTEHLKLSLRHYEKMEIAQYSPL